jgi:hypothetical protein
MATEDFAPDSTLIQRKPRGLRILFAAAVLYAVASAVGAIALIWQILAEREVRVRMPVTAFWPTLVPSAHITEGPTAKVVSGGFSEADVMVSGLGLDAKLWLASGHLVQGATFVVLALVVAMLCRRMLRGDPFRGLVSRTAAIAATTIALGGIVWQICFGAGGWTASIQVLQVTAWNVTDADVVGDDLSKLGWPDPAQGFSVDFWPFLIALALLVVFLIFRYGEELRAENERLDRIRLALQRDTDGLV